MRRTFVSSATIAGLLAWSLAGCGGGGGGGQGETPKATTPAAAPTTTAAGPQAATPTTAAPAAGQEGAKEGADDEGPLLAWADADTDEGKAPLTVAFTADIEGGKQPLKVKWTFGDNTPDSTETNPKHTYDKPGKYRADLEVTDAAGDTDSDYVEIDVN